jgi:hypothetical protein
MESSRFNILNAIDDAIVGFRSYSILRINLKIRARLTQPTLLPHFSCATPVALRSIRRVGNTHEKPNAHRNLTQELF